MFLDSDVSHTRTWRVQALAASGYSIAEIERILADEIFPVCGPNLLAVAGEWAGFDIAWLESCILARERVRSRWGRLFNLGRFAVHHFGEWQATKAELAAVRDEHDGAGRLI